jgi:hypothetical protein
MGGMARPRTPVPATLSELYQRAVYAPRSGCLLWDGRMNQDGYGQIGISRNHAAELGIGQTILVHRLAWELANGPIQPGLQIDHICRNRPCINVEHLEAVTSSENVRRSDAPVLSAFRLQAQRALQREAYKTHCVHGHALTPDNVYADRRGFRSCRTCQNERSRVWRAANPGWRQRYK